MALRKVMAYGAVPKANCTRSTSSILGELPGFEGIRTVFFPEKLEEQFAKLPGVRTFAYREDDPDDIRHQTKLARERAVALRAA